MKDNKNIKNIASAVFDLDGTVLNSSEAWNGLGERYLSLKGITLMGGDISRTLRDSTFEEGCAFLQKNYLPELSERKIKAELRSLISDFYRNECQLKRGAAELIEALFHRGIHISAATAGDGELASAALSRLGVLRFFSGIYACAEYGGKDKPDIFLCAANAPASKTVVFEDSLSAIITAKNAGFITAAVFDISEPRKEQLTTTADYYEKDLFEYLKYLGN